MVRRSRQHRPVPTAATTTRRAAWVTVAWLLAVFALKLALALTLAPHPLLQPEGDLDAGEYWRLAQRVTGGDPWLRATPFYVSPLYIYWLAAAMALTGGSVTGVLVLQALAGTIAVWLVARTTTAWCVPATRGADVAPALAGGTLALTGIVALQEALILQSALDPLLIALLAFTFTRALQASSMLRWVACGAALALLATNRPNAWLLAVPCVAAAGVVPAGRSTAGGLGVRGRMAAPAAWCLGVLVVLAPIVVRTAVATGEWHALPGHGGLNLYIGNHAAANGTYAVVEGIRPSMAGQREDMRRVAAVALGHAPSDAEASAHFVRESIAWWRHDPIAATRLFAYKLWLAVHSWELPVNVSYAWFREQVLLVKLLPVGAWLLVPAGIAGVVGGHVAVPDAYRAAWRWFRWLLPAYLVSVAVFFVVDRYRAPALVLGAIYSGVFASTWIPLVADRGRAPGADGAHRRAGGPAAWTGIACAVVLFVAGAVPLPFQLGQAEADTRMALAAIGGGRDEEARTWLARAVSRDPAPGVAWFRAGLAWQSRNDLAHAEHALREAHRLDPEVADVAFALASVLLTEGRGAEAVPLLDQAERAGVRPDRVRLDLALASWQAGDQARARAVLARGVPPEGMPLLRARALASVEARRDDLAEWLLTEHRRYVQDDAEVAEKLGLMTARRGDAARAAALFEEAARLDPSRATARFNLALVRLQQGRRDDAIGLLREALRIDPTYARAAGALRELLGTR